MSRATEIVQQFEDAFVAGDMERVLSIVSEDIVVHEAPGAPYPGEHHGHEGFLALATAFGQCWDLQGPLQLDILEAGPDRALALVEFDAVAKLVGQVLRIRIAEVYTVCDDKIADVDVYYWDGAAIAAATGGVKVLQGT